MCVCAAERILSVLLPEAGLTPTALPTAPAPAVAASVIVQRQQETAAQIRNAKRQTPQFTAKPDWLIGCWEGMIGEGRGVGDRQPMAVTMAVDGDGRVHIRLADQPWTVLTDATVEPSDGSEGSDGAWLRGVFVGDRRTVRLYFLELRDSCWTTFLDSCGVE